MNTSLQIRTLTWRITEAIVTHSATVQLPDYHICFNIREVKPLRFVGFHVFRVFTFVVAESQAGEIKACVSFCGAKLSRMIADSQKA